MERIEFYGLSGKVGHLDLEDGRFTFEGDADQSAHALFISLHKLISERIQEAYMSGWSDALKEKIN